MESGQRAQLALALTRPQPQPTSAPARCLRRRQPVRLTRDRLVRLQDGAQTYIVAQGLKQNSATLHHILKTPMIKPGESE